MITLDIPAVPSVNHLFANNKRDGRSKTKHYRAWRAQATAAILAQGRPRLLGPYEIHLAHNPRGRRADLGNLEKAASDILVHTGVIEEDSKARRICMWFDYDLPAHVGCRVTLKEWEAGQ